MKYLCKISLLLFTLFAIVELSSSKIVYAEAQPLINEIMASNTSTIMDEDGDYPN